jgi:hypothetical protein
MTNDDRHCHSSSGCHITVGDMAPQIVVVVGCGRVCGGRSVVSDNIGNVVTVR